MNGGLLAVSRWSPGGLSAVSRRSRRETMVVFKICEVVLVMLENNVTAVSCRNNYFAAMGSGSEAGSYLRLIDFCITQL